MRPTAGAGRGGLGRGWPPNLEEGISAGRRRREEEKEGEEREGGRSLSQAEFATGS